MPAEADLRVAHLMSDPFAAWLSPATPSSVAGAGRSPMRPGACRRRSSRLQSHHSPTNGHKRRKTTAHTRVAIVPAGRIPPPRDRSL